MPGFTLFSGNRLELLAEKFAAIVRSSPPDPLVEEFVVIQSTGMMKWLSMKLAEELDIWSNCRYMFPNPSVSQIMDSFFPGMGEGRFFDKDLMTFKIMGILGNREREQLSQDIAGYIANDPTGIKLYQISAKIADTFDQYITFRPDMILDWERGDSKNNDWQPMLWRELTGDSEKKHPPALMEELFRSLKDPGFAPAASLPSRISVFGISYLPLFHINLLRAAALFTDVYLYILNPSNTYWGDILKEKEKTGIMARTRLAAADPLADFHLESGNTLLASMGRVGRDFSHYLFSSDIDSEGVFIPPEGDSLLSLIQQDIYSLTDRGGETRNSVYQFSMERISGDNSILINSCHSGMREIEVLHDYLLDLFNEDHSLEPGDILVMTPDMENYSDYIQAVFERTASTAKWIPYSIADRKIRATSPSVEIFFKILELQQSRFTSAEVLSFLDNEHIRARYELTHGEVEKINSWVSDTGIYWGIDGEYKGGLGLPECPENTWQAGIDRMITGFLVPNRGELCMDVLPYDIIEGGDALILGRFISFFKNLSLIADIIKSRRDLVSWADSIVNIAEMMFGEKGEIPVELQPVMDAVSSLRDIYEESRFYGETDIAVIRSYLDRSLAGISSTQNFINGNVTFCEMLPMRSIPFKVVCLVGMNSRLFPRKSRAPGFDIIAANPKRGDRSVRDEDRYLFLETIISAREKLYISYTGRSMRSNEEMNPSIVVSEVIDYIDQGFIIKNSDVKVKDLIIKNQRLQPFNPVYFNGSKLYSYNENALKNALLSISAEGGEYPFLDTRLPELSLEMKSPGIDEFISFFVNPSKALLSRRLGIALDPGESSLREEEPFVPDGLDRYSVNMEILNALEQGRDMDDFYNILRARGLLPHGVPGKVFYKNSLEEQRKFFSIVAPYISVKDENINISAEAGGITISGKISSLYRGNNIFYRYSTVKSRDLLRGWITHILLSAQGWNNGETILFSRDKRILFSPLSSSAALEFLSQLTEIYKTGMRERIPLFERSSFAYAGDFYSAASEPGKKALISALKAFSGDYGSGKDIDNIYVNKLFSSYRLDRDFEKYALKVYAPVFENMRQGEIDDQGI